MEWASAVSGRVDSRTALKEALRALMSERRRPPDVVLVFVSQHHASACEQIAGWLRDELPGAVVAGCSATGVIGGGTELEGREAVSLTGGWLPGVQVRVHHLPEPPEEPSPAFWITYMGLNPADPCHFMLIVDPFGFELDPLLRSLDAAFPESSKFGGLASGTDGEQPVALIAGGQVHRGGALVLSFQGSYELRTVVSQGCRPVGEPFIVTRASGNVIKELNTGKPADVLRRVYTAMNARDHSLFNTSLFLGLGIGEGTHFASGDFLIRNVLGIDPDSGAMAIDARIEAYQVAQFHLRDHETAAQDLSQRLRELTRGELAAGVRGALMFSCLGRGERLYGVANHDSDAFARRVGPVSLSGFFCSGEIGPVGAKTYLHGYTSVFAVFCSRS
jgi:small ligand-binding sensory domain FIST